MRTLYICYFGLREPLKAVPIPLRQADADVTLDLQAILDQVYLNGSYGYEIDYTRPPAPPLDPEDAAWAKALLSRTT